MINNLNAISNVIDYYHSLFLADNIGYKSLPKEDREFLKSKGYQNVLKKNEDLLTLAYKFGKIASEKDSKILDKLNYAEFSSFSRDKMVLSKEDRFVIEHIKANFYNDVKRAGNRVKDNVNSEIVKISKDRRYYIRKKLKGKFIDKDFKMSPQILNHLSKYLKGKQKEWNDHFDLITSFNMHSAFQQGVASSLLNKYGDSCTISFILCDDACTICKDLYLNSDGTPKVFKLLDVLSNGDNIGRKKVEMKAVCGSTHPRCRCRIKYNQNVKRKTKKIQT